MDGWLHEWMDLWMGGWMDGRMVKAEDKSVCSQYERKAKGPAKPRESPTSELGREVWCPQTPGQLPP